VGHRIKRWRANIGTCCDWTQTLSSRTPQPRQFSILTEAPFFQFQSALLLRVSVSAVMHASMLFLALRLALYSLLPLAPSAWWVLPIELLHGVTFATSWGAGIVSCKRLAPPHLNTTMQSIFSALYGGVGSGLGGILGGVAMQRLGAAAMFAAFSGVVLGGWGLAWGIDVGIDLVRRRRAGAGAPAGASSCAAKQNLSAAKR